MRQTFLHLHPYPNDLPALRRGVLAHLQPLAQGSAALLRYAGPAP